MDKRICGTFDAKERDVLYGWVHGQRIEHRLQFRASIIWQLFAERATEEQVAETLETTVKTVSKWRDRFREQGIHGLHDLPRSGAPGKFDVVQRCEVIALACDEPNRHGFPNDTHWTVDRLQEAAQRETEGPVMSRSSVHRALQQNVLRPHKMKMWLHSIDPLFREKVNDVVGLYTDPPEDAIVLSIDEKTGIQALERKYDTQLPAPRQAGRYEYEYIRHGTVSMITSFATQTGEVLSHCGPTRTADDLIAFMDTVAEHYKHHGKILVIWDNLNIHHDGPSRRWTEFNERHGNKFEFHYTPIHASWVNQVEIFFSIVQKRVLKWGNFHSDDELKERLMAFVQRWNETDGHPFRWTFRGYPMQKEAA